MTSSSIPPPLFDESTALGEVRARLWKVLAEAANRPELPLSCGQLSTCTPAGPRSRILILRAVDQERRQIFSHTDFRSPKVQELTVDDRVSWLFYDYAIRLQVRVWGTARPHVKDDIARSLWTAARPETRKLYLAPQAPGTPAAGPSRNQPQSIQPDDLTGESPPHVFAVILTQVAGMDVLQVRPGGSLRAEFLWTGDSWDSRWMQP